MGQCVRMRREGRLYVRMTRQKHCSSPLCDICTSGRLQTSVGGCIAAHSELLQRIQSLSTQAAMSQRAQDRQVLWKHTERRMVTVVATGGDVRWEH